MSSRLLFSPALRRAIRAPQPLAATISKPLITRLTPSQLRSLSSEVSTAIDQAITSNPVVLFMKGTPETPQCGFSRACIQILGLQGVDPQKFSAFNVLEDDSLRAGIKEYSDWPTIPQLYVQKEFIGGCDILMSMHQNGELAKLFANKEVLLPAEGNETPSEGDTPAVEATAAETTAEEETLAENGTPGKS